MVGTGIDYFIGNGLTPFPILLLRRYIMKDNLNQLESILKVLYHQYEAQKVLRSCGDYYGITAEEYVEIAFSYTGIGETEKYSQEDLRNQFMYFSELIQMKKKRDSKKAPGKELINPMDCLFYYVVQMLIIQDNEVLCRYDYLTSWRNLTLSVDEDLLVAAFLATKMIPEEVTGRDLSWRLVIRNDNFQLRRILERGLAENHFHLFGSAPVFHLSWISLMNRLNMTKATVRLIDYDRQRMKPIHKADATKGEVPLWVQYLQAAIIRVYLFARVTPYIGYHLEQSCSDRKNDQNYYERFMERMAEKLIDMLQESLINKRFGMYESQNQLGNLQNTMYELQNQLGDLQNTIDTFRDWCGSSMPDYAMLGCPDIHEGTNEILRGERWLLFQCLSRIRNNLFSIKYTNLFYIYLLIKENIRKELIQTDNRTGFSHFQDYEHRKFDLMDYSIFRGDTGVIAKNAVRENLLNTNIQSLEIRISPGMTPRDDFEIIRNLDRIIGKKHEKYFYTFHFLKRQDSWKKKETDPEVFYCRHDALRRLVKKQTNAIREFREYYPNIAKRVIGIDAASQEIGCRPEVFATCYRFLHEHTIQIDYGTRKENLPQLRKTYHVGEDFLDVTDGLRAIDEAIRFLELKSGDRLGHALALGVNVEEWYKSKNYTISLKKQDYLDNIAWLYHMLLKYKIAETEVLREFLKREFSTHFQELYLKNMPEGIISVILKRFRNDGLKKEGDKRYVYEQLNFDIYQYFRAWRLRGDDPTLYSSGFYQPPTDDTDYDRCRIRSYESRYPEKERYIPEVFLLYYFYHYSKVIREEGERQYQTKVMPIYIDGVAKVQKALQLDIGRRGLAIETNPTSNIRIGITKLYNKHPILNFYNRELEVDPKLLAENPQLLVSINTDDQGIFCTSLENEYALLASSLENEVDEYGIHRYPKQRVYAWIDSIRKMGIDQTFANKNMGDYSEATIGNTQIADGSIED